MSTAWFARSVVLTDFFYQVPVRSRAVHAVINQSFHLAGYVRIEISFGARPMALAFVYNMGLGAGTSLREIAVFTLVACGRGGGVAGEAALVGTWSAGVRKECDFTVDLACGAFGGFVFAFFAFRTASI